MNVTLNLLQSIHRWDVTTFQRIRSARWHRGLVDVAFVFSRSGDGWGFLFLPLFACLLNLHLWPQYCFALMLAIGFERLVYLAVKNTFKRRRPPSVVPNFSSLIIANDEFSFPSGHTSAAFLSATMTVLFFGDQYSFLFVWATCIAASRVILGVHFPTDTLVGGIIGSGIAAMVFMYRTVI